METGRRLRALTIARMRLLAVLTTLTTLLACGDAPPPSNGEVEGEKLATSLVAHLGSSLQLSAPFRCARIQTDRATPVIPGMNVTMEGATLRLDSFAEKKSVTLAFIADARGHDKETVRAASALRARFAEEGVDVLLSLGGHDREEDSIAALLSALTADAPYLTLAIPGDRESVTGHRQAVRDLAKSGARILDGAQYRMLSLGNVLVATMPGISMEANLVAANDGCLHTEADTRELLKYVEKSKLPVLIASYAPVRQEGLGGSDLGAGGIHAGEKLLQPLLATDNLSLLIHGMVGLGSSDSKGKHRMGQASRSLAAGSLDPLDGPSMALIITITGKRLNWRRIEAPVE